MKILLALDDSECSARAVETLAVHGVPEGCQVRIVTVVDSFQSLPRIDETRKRVFNRAENLVREVSDRLAAVFPRSTVEGELLFGYTKERLLQEIRDWRADVVVAGSHGRAGMTRFLLGSVSQTLLHNSACTVRIIREPQSQVARQTGRIRNVLLAVDQSPFSQVAVEKVRNANWGSEVHFTILTVIEGLPDCLRPDLITDSERPMTKEYEEKLLVDARDFAEFLARSFKESFGPDRITTLIMSGNPRERILQAIGECSIDLVVMGSHGQRLVGCSHLGSVAETVALHAPCSVEVVKSEAAYARVL